MYKKTQSNTLIYQSKQHVTTVFKILLLPYVMCDPRHLGAAKRARTIRAQQKGRRTKRAKNKKGQEQKGRRTKRARDHDVASQLHSRSFQFQLFIFIPSKQITTQFLLSGAIVCHRTCVLHST